MNESNQKQQQWQGNGSTYLERVCGEKLKNLYLQKLQDVGGSTSPDFILNLDMFTERYIKRDKPEYKALIKYITVEREKRNEKGKRGDKLFYRTEVKEMTNLSESTIKRHGSNNLLVPYKKKSGKHLYNYPTLFCFIFCMCFSTKERKQVVSELEQHTRRLQIFVEQNVTAVNLTNLVNKREKDLRGMRDVIDKHTSQRSQSNTSDTSAVSPMKKEQNERQSDTAEGKKQASTMITPTENDVKMIPREGRKVSPENENDTLLRGNGDTSDTSDTFQRRQSDTSQSGGDTGMNERITTLEKEVAIERVKREYAEKTLKDKQEQLERERENSRIKETWISDLREENKRLKALKSGEERERKDTEVPIG